MNDQEKVLTTTTFFNNLTFEEAVREVHALSKKQHFSYVVTPNVDHLQRLNQPRTDKDLLSVYKNASLSLCDSRVLGKLLALKGKRVKEIIPGSTLTQHLFDNVLTKNDSILVVGIENHYVEKLRQSYAHLSIHHINPSMGFINKPREVDELIESIAAINVNYIFLSVGSPRQEILASIVSQNSKIRGVGLCVGASVLFLVGAEKRAPIIFQWLHLEWAYRMLQSPKRLFFRYMNNILSLPRVYKSL